MSGKKTGGIFDLESLKIALNYMPCGVSIIDKDLNVIAWNEEVLELQDYSRHLFENRNPTFEEVVRDICARGDYGEVDTEKKVAEMVALAQKFEPHHIIRERADGTVLEIRGCPMPDGGFITTYTDITERYNQEKEIEKLVEKLKEAAHHDPLTGLANRVKLVETFDNETKRQKRSGKDLSMVVLDLDHFKKVNDTYGHVAGDKVLTRTAEILNDGIRGTDLPARLGGEEFAILLPETSRKGAEELAEKLRNAIEERGVHAPDSNIEIHFTGSFGTATMTADAPFTFVDFLNRADQGVYAAKSDGRNRVRTVI